MSSKYDALTEFLEDQPPDQPVSLSVSEVDRIVGGLPSGARRRTWWANTSADVQTKSWLKAGRRVLEVVEWERVVFSPIIGRDEEPEVDVILDGITALEDLIAKAGYHTVTEVVAASTVFLHPDTVRQTGGSALFPVVNVSPRRGVIERNDGVRVISDDATTPKRCFLWAAQAMAGRDVRVTHLWRGASDPDTYTSLWNLCAVPGFLGDIAEGIHAPDVLQAIQFRSYELFGFLPEGAAQPDEPAGYRDLQWPESPAPVGDLEIVLRRGLELVPRSRAATAVREVGWLFSGWQPDSSLPS